MKNNIYIIIFVFTLLSSCSKENLTNENNKQNIVTKDNIKPQVQTTKNEKKTSPLICIDPGHQKNQNTSLEVNGPGSKIKKAKISSGTSGISTKKPEYQLVLEISLKLKEKLLNNNYNVFMIRESNNVNISNKERALLANSKKCDAYIRIHADGNDNKSIHGISMQTSSKNNPYIKNMFQQNNSLSNLILNETIKSTNANNRGIIYRDDLTGTNWSNVPTTLIELGFMSNHEEDIKLSTKTYQDRLVNGIFNGLNKFIYPNQNGS